MITTGWARKYGQYLAILDAIVVFWAMSGALILRFGTPQGGELISTAGESYILITLILSILWWAMLGWWGSRDPLLLGYGTEEFKLVLSASFALFGMLAVVSYALQLDIARGYVGLALPAGLSSLLLMRVLIRSFLRSQRRNGGSSSSVMIVGGTHGAEHLAKALISQPMAGYRPVAIYTPGRTDTGRGGSSLLPNLGTDPSVTAILTAVRSSNAEAVALSSGVPLPPQTIRELGWALADMKVKMILAPALTDVAGPRIHTQPVAGLPLVHVSTPNLRGGQRLLKRTLDLSGAGVLLLVLSPVLAIVAMAVKWDSRGPILFKQQRVGANGVVFQMYKFRSMVVDAESQLESLRLQSEGNGVLFKIKADPRVTRVGRFIRRFSLDELPQLINVLNGTMSLVGPRPPLSDEVAQYQSHVRRRLLVRPGLTGLWQVSGRSLLSWDDSVRLDLYYVENWSLLGDIVILLKTFRAVLGRHGAY